ncbi:MAG: MauE/DoxX family redox-associated membrane protein [Desulfobacterales bacterium]
MIPQAPSHHRFTSSIENNITGDAAKNPCMTALLGEKLAHRILMPKGPQPVGALRAALFAKDRHPLRHLSHVISGEMLSTVDYLYRLCRWGIAGIFIYAGSIKLLEPQIFAVLISAYGIVPESLLMSVSIGLLILEVIAGIGLLFDIEGSLAAVAGLLGLFIAVLSYGIWVGLDVDCGCFGPQDPEAAAFHGLRSSLYRDLVMLAGTFFMYGWRRYRAIEPVRIRPLMRKVLKKRRTEDAYG